MFVLFLKLFPGLDTENQYTCHVISSMGGEGFKSHELSLKHAHAYNKHVN